MGDGVREGGLRSLSLKRGGASSAMETTVSVLGSDLVMVLPTRGRELVLTT